MVINEYEYDAHYENEALRYKLNVLEARIVKSNKHLE